MTKNKYTGDISTESAVVIAVLVVIFVAMFFLSLGCQQAELPQRASFYEAQSNWFAADPFLYLNTMATCDAKPKYDRAVGGRSFDWGGTSYMMLNIGNELRIEGEDESYFHVPHVGDSDLDLLSFSVADARYGVAVYKAGAVLFDLGTGATPTFTDHSFYTDARYIPGAFTFVHDGQQYLIGSGFSNECKPNSTLYRFQGLDDLDPVGCLEITGKTVETIGGFYAGHHLYLPDKSGRVYIFDIVGTPTGITLEYRSAPWLVNMIKGDGLAVDIAAGIAVEATSNGANIYDISDTGEPLLITTIPGDFNRAAVRYPVVALASLGIRHSEQTYDITVPINPVPFDQDFWSSEHAWNYPDAECTAVMALGFHGTDLWVMRYSVLQRMTQEVCGDTSLVFESGFETGNTGEWS